MKFNEPCFFYCLGLLRSRIMFIAYDDKRDVRTLPYSEVGTAGIYRSYCQTPSSSLQVVSGIKMSGLCLQPTEEFEVDMYAQVQKLRLTMILALKNHFVWKELKMELL